MKALDLFKKTNKKGEKNYEKIFNIFISNVYDSILDYKNYNNYSVTNGKRLFRNDTNK